MNWIMLIIFIVICEAVGLGGAVFTAKAIPTWYAKLNKPSFSPPNWIFGPVWTLLYALQGIAAYIIFQYPGGNTAISLFVIQLGLNAFWTPLFFGAKKLGWAFAEILLMLFFILITVVSFFKIDSGAGWLMLPYAAWVSFASLLNYKLWRLNQDKKA